METLDQDLKEILEAAVRAPSGDNLQPWRFVLSGNIIRIFNVNRHDSLINFKLRASLVSHGALIENIVIISSKLGYLAHVTLFLNGEKREHIADIVLQKGDVATDPLYAFIGKRRTNRKKYLPTSLTVEQRQRVLSAPGKLDCFGEVRIIEEPEQKREAAKLLSNTEKITFGNQGFHRSLYDEFRWSAAETERTKDGLDVGSLEFSFLELLLVKIMKSWSVSHFLSKMGVASLIAHRVAVFYESAGAICAIVVKGNSSEDFVCGGRIMQRLWLQATQMGLSVQPVYGLLLLGQRVEEKREEVFSPTEAKLIETAYEKIKSLFSIKDETITFMLRIGNAPAPSVLSLRKDPEIIIE